MSCRMINQIGMIRLINLFKPCLIANRSNQHNQIQIGILFLQLKLDVVRIILINIKND